MQFELLHPADQIIMMMERIYGYGMTTTSGGNLSIMDDNGDIWITPASVDKGSLTRQDIMQVKPDGTIIGNHKPSSEFPFHQLVYKKRPDLKAVVHAHPPALVAFSIARKIPDTHLLPGDYKVVGQVGMAEYAIPGSVLLGENIAAIFESGINTVMLENHGIVVGGLTLFEAFKAFETLEYAARLEIKANRIGKTVSIGKEKLETLKRPPVTLKDAAPTGYSSEERAARREMCKLIHRSYDQRLFNSTQGTFSQRLEGNSFLITPYNQDRKYLEPADLVRVSGNTKEAGKTPSRSFSLHQYIYETQPHVNSIIVAHPPNIMAFAVTEQVFDSRTIPESYIMLRNVVKLPVEATYSQQQETAKVFTTDKPIAIVENSCVIVTGQSLLNAFDRLEVAEFSAMAIISAVDIGQIVHIDQEKIDDIDVAFNLK